MRQVSLVFKMRQPLGTGATPHMPPLRGILNMQTVTKPGLYNCGMHMCWGQPGRTKCCLWLLHIHYSLEMEAMHERERVIRGEWGLRIVSVINSTKKGFLLCLLLLASSTAFLANGELSLSPGGTKVELPELVLFCTQVLDPQEDGSGFFSTKTRFEVMFHSNWNACY